MFERQRTGSVLCPGCSQLVGVNDEACLNCGRRKPGLWGFAKLLRGVGDDMGFRALVLGGCSLLYLATLVSDLEGMGASGGLFSLFAPSGRSLLRWGMTGAVPVVVLDRWWTLLAAGWLHGSALHLAFNLMGLRDLLPQIAHLYGPARTVIIYTASTVSGFLLATYALVYAPFLPGPLAGSAYVMGASCALFGLLGALLWYGHRGGSGWATAHARQWLIGGVLFGLMSPSVSNLGHLGGFLGGYLAARFLDPLHPERGDHVIVAAVCLLATGASIVASVLIPLPSGR